MQQPINWEECYLHYRSDRDLHWLLFGKVVSRDYCFFVKQQELPRLTDFEETILPETIGVTDLPWLIASLANSERKWFAAFAIDRTSFMPEELLIPMLQAAINEGDPSYNRIFVLPCLRFYGHRRVNHILLDVIQQESNQQKLGAVSALYWAGYPVMHLLDGSVVPESEAVLHQFDDVWERKRRVLLEEFIQNTDVEVRRRLMSLISLGIDNYLGELYPKLLKVLELARTDAELCRLYASRWAHLVS